MPEYVLKGETKAKNLGYCPRCRQPFQKGQIIVSRGHRGKQRVYHKECWESMFLDCEDDEL